MGATKKLFSDLREKELTVNATFIIKGKLLNVMEDFLLENTNLINYKVIPDTKDLYEKDKTFQKLVKIEKSARKEKELYINAKN